MNLMFIITMTMPYFISYFSLMTYITSTFAFGPCILPIIVPLLLFLIHPTILSSAHRSRQYLVKYTPITHV